MSEAFEELCPQYLALGMPWDLYWNGDAAAVRHYIGKGEIDRQRASDDAWLQGLYVYEAVGDLAPILHAFAKKGAKARKYMSRPLPATEAAREAERRMAAAEEREEILARAHAWMHAVNAAHAEQQR